MLIQVELSWVVGTMLGVAGLFWGLAQMMLNRSQSHIDKQFQAITETLKGQDTSSRRIERELMELKAELPRDYVRREDYNRMIGSIQVSVDNVSLKLDRTMQEMTTRIERLMQERPAK